MYLCLGRKVHLTDVEEDGSMSCIQPLQYCLTTDIDTSSVFLSSYEAEQSVLIRATSLTYSKGLKHLVGCFPQALICRTPWAN